MPGIWGDIGVGPFMPRRGFLDSLRQQQGYAQSPSGPQGASMRNEPSFEDYRRPEVPPAPRAPIDVAPPLQPAAAPTFGSVGDYESWLGKLMQGIDPARLGIQGMFGQQQPRTIQTTDPGAGYGQSPSGPTAQMPARQPQMRRPQQNVTEQFSVPANYGQSPSNPNWQPRTPKPKSPFYEGPRPTIGVTRETRSPIAPTSNRRAMVQESKDYARSPSNPNWRPPGG